MKTATVLLLLTTVAVLSLCHRPARWQIRLWAAQAINRRTGCGPPSVSTRDTR